MRRSVALLGLLLLVAVPGSADTITFAFTGYVEAIDDTNGHLTGHPGVHLGAPMHGEITYDLDSPDIDAREGLATYIFDQLPSGISFRVDGLLFSSGAFDDGFDLAIDVTTASSLVGNDYFIMTTNSTRFPEDVDLRLGQGGGSNAIDFQLHGPFGGANWGEALPTDLNLSDWRWGAVEAISSSATSDDYYRVVTRLETLRRQPPTPVPEPGSLLLLATGVLGAFVAVRRHL